MPLIKGQINASFSLPTNTEVVADATDELLLVDSNDELFRITKEDFLNGVTGNIDLTLINNSISTLQSSVASKISVPTTIKNVAASGDYFIGIDNSGLLYRISKSDLLAGLSSGGDETLPGGGSISDPYFSDVVLLLPFDSDFLDVKGKSPTVSGSPSIDTTTLKNGAGSLTLNGSSTLFFQSSTAWNFTNNFTVECFVRFNDVNGEQPILTNYANGANGWAIEMYGGKFHVSLKGDGASINGNLSVLPNTWYYIALVLDGTDFKLYVNGEQDGNTYGGISSLSGEILKVGSLLNSVFLRGNIDNVRITKRARNVSSIPTSAFPTS